MQFGAEVRQVITAFTTTSGWAAAPRWCHLYQYFVRDRRQIIELAAKHRLPAMYEWREQAVDGGLMSYSTSLYGLQQRVASYVDRIRKGAKPEDLPIERTTKFGVVINLA